MIPAPTLWFTATLHPAGLGLPDRPSTPHLQVGVYTGERLVRRGGGLEIVGLGGGKQSRPRALEGLALASPGP